jgi:hypothetical protein
VSGQLFTLLGGVTVEEISDLRLVMLSSGNLVEDEYLERSPECKCELGH